MPARTAVLARHHSRIAATADVELEMMTEQTSCSPCTFTCEAKPQRWILCEWLDVTSDCVAVFVECADPRLIRDDLRDEQSGHRATKALRSGNQALLLCAETTLAQP